jgi:hypothetical protein
MICLSVQNFLIIVPVCACGLNFPVINNHTTCYIAVYDLPIGTKLSFHRTSLCLRLNYLVSNNHTTCYIAVYDLSIGTKQYTFYYHTYYFVSVHLIIQLTITIKPLTLLSMFVYRYKNKHIFLSHVPISEKFTYF